MDEIIKAVVIGLITGCFSAGAVYGVLKTELRYMRRDIDSVRRHLGWE